MKSRRVSTASVVAGLALAGALDAPRSATAESSLADGFALALEANARTVEAGEPDRSPAQDSGSWDGLVTIVIEYLDPTAELDSATARLASAQGKPAT